MRPAITDDLVAGLVTRCQRGEAAALGQLYDLFADRLYRYLLLRVADGETAADLTTEVFLRVIKSIGAFRLDRERPAATVSAWLFRIAANLVAEHYRAQRRRPSLGLDDSLVSSAVHPGPQDVAEQHEKANELALAVSQLSVAQQMVIVGRFVEGMTLTEVAGWLNKTEGAIKSLQHRALRSLARLMRNDAP